MTVLNSSFANGKSAVNSEGSDSRPPSPSSPGRRLIFVEEDVELFHLVLFYLYTEQIMFIDSPDSTERGSNVTHDAEAVYALAHRLMIDSLEHKAAHFLKATTNVENISQRTFAKFALEHQAMGTWYDEYFLVRWEEVKSGGEFEKVFDRLEEDVDEYVRVSIKFRHMIKRLGLR